MIFSAIIRALCEHSAWSHSDQSQLRRARSHRRHKRYFPKVSEQVRSAFKKKDIIHQTRHNNFSRYESIIANLCENLDTLDEPEARASMIWIIGEYAERIDNADELLESFLEGFHDENTQVRSLFSLFSLYQLLVYFSSFKM